MLAVHSFLSSGFEKIKRFLSWFNTVEVLTFKKDKYLTKKNTSRWLFNICTVKPENPLFLEITTNSKKVIFLRPPVCTYLALCDTNNVNGKLEWVKVLNPQFFC